MVPPDRFSDAFANGFCVVGKLRRHAPLKVPREGRMSSLPNNLTEDRGFSYEGGSLRERVRKATRQLEAELIKEALDRHRWNRRRAAEALNISYRSLMYKMRSCNLRNSVAEGAPEERKAGGRDGD
jgi:DNA-binding NtrC family response regulator